MVETQCPSPGTFLSINYLRDYFCTKPQLRSLAFVGLIVWRYLLFSTLGISARISSRQILLPSRSCWDLMRTSLRDVFGIWEWQSGCLLHVFGNASQLRKSRHRGNCLERASFIVSCVVGSMCIIKPFEGNRNHFLRDVGFFTVAVSLLLVILWDGHIRPWEAAIMIVLYLIYVTYVVVGTWWGKKA